MLPPPPAYLCWSLLIGALGTGPEHLAAGVDLVAGQLLDRDGAPIFHRMHRLTDVCRCRDADH